jgi:hypothetical protein
MDEIPGNVLQDNNHSASQYIFRLFGIRVFVTVLSKA